MTTANHPRRKLASTSEIAAIYGIAPKTVRRLIANGTLPAFRIGRQIRIDIATAEAALMKPMNTSTATLAARKRTARATAR